MFTGIVDHCGEITAIHKTDKGLSFTIQSAFKDLISGESISVDGACLTVVNPNQSIFSVDLSEETLRLTTASQYQVGAKVNLERAMRACDRFGGHYVTGHVDVRVKVSDIKTVGDCKEIVFSGISPEDKRYLIHKGSVCINGVSLTINAVTSLGFKVMLIPHTLERTSLHNLTTDTLVNIEFDWMVKTVAAQLKMQEESLQNA